MNYKSIDKEELEVLLNTRREVLITVPIILIVGSIIIASGFIFIYYPELFFEDKKIVKYIKENLNIQYAALIYSLTIFSLFVLLALLFDKKYNADIRLKKKIVVEGVVQKKEIEKRFGFHGDILVDGFSKLKPNSTCYYLIMNGAKHEVKKEVFDFIAEGERIKIHKTLKSRYILKYEKLIA